MRPFLFVFRIQEIKSKDQRGWTVVLLLYLYLFLFAVFVVCCVLFVLCVCCTWASFH